MNNRLAELERFLHQQAPLTGFMQIAFKRLDEQGLVLRAPLEPNSNHHQTAFGGSIATLGIVAGWAMVYLQLGDTARDFDLVINKSQIEYLQPVCGDFEAHCLMPEETLWRDFSHKLKTRGKARVQLQTQIRCQGDIAARLSSTYAALKKSVS